MKKEYICLTTGEIAVGRFGVIKAILENIFKFGCFDTFKWKDYSKYEW